MSLLDDILRSKLQEVTQGPKVPSVPQGPNPAEVLRVLEEEMRVLEATRRQATRDLEVYLEEQGVRRSSPPPPEYYTSSRDPHYAPRPGSALQPHSTVYPLYPHGPKVPIRSPGVRFSGLPEASAGTVSVDESWSPGSHDQRIRATVTMTVDAREYYRFERPEVLIEELARSLARILMTKEYT